MPLLGCATAGGWQQHPSHQHQSTVLARACLPAAAALAAGWGAAAAAAAVFVATAAGCCCSLLEQPGNAHDSRMKERVTVRVGCGRRPAGCTRTRGTHTHFLQRQQHLDPHFATIHSLCAPSRLRNAVCAIQKPKVTLMHACQTSRSTGLLGNRLCCCCRDDWPFFCVLCNTRSSPVVMIDGPLLCKVCLLVVNRKHTNRGAIVIAVSTFTAHTTLLLVL